MLQTENPTNKKTSLEICKFEAKYGIYTRVTGDRESRGLSEVVVEVKEVAHEMLAWTRSIGAYSSSTGHHLRRACLKQSAKCVLHHHLYLHLTNNCIDCVSVCSRLASCRRFRPGAREARGAHCYCAHGQAQTNLRPQRCVVQKIHFDACD